MAVIPTFSSYAQTPNLAQAYLGGQEIQVARERIAQQAAEAANRIAMEREQLNAQMVATEMEWAARKDIEAKKALQQAQEFEIQKAYQQTQLGISQRNLEREDLSLKLKLAEAAEDFAAQQAWQRDYPRLVTEGINAGKTKEDAERDAARSLMLQRGGIGIASAITPQREEKVRVSVGTTPMGEDRFATMPISAAQRFILSAPDEVKTNAVNRALLESFQPPRTVTGTNALRILNIRRRQ